MKIIKYSRISQINIGDVFISAAINFADEKTSNNVLENQDLLFEDFELNKRIDAASKSNKFYQVKKRSKISSFCILLIKILLFHIKDQKKIMKQIKASEVVFIGGGNIISEHNGSDLFYRVCQLAKMGSKQNKKIVVYGVGMGPFEFSYKKRLASLINLSHYFSVRDSNSFLIANSIGYELNKNIAQNIDPGFLISDMQPQIAEEKKFIGLNFMNFGRIVENSEFEVSVVIENLIELHSYYKMPFKIINTSFGEDLSISLNIKEILLAAGIPVSIYNIKNLKEVSFAYSDLKFFIASRMHSSIFAMSYNVPTLIFSWHPKVEFLMDLLFGVNRLNVLLESENFDATEIIFKISNYSKVINLENIINAKKINIYNDYEKIFQVIN